MVKISESYTEKEQAEVRGKAAKQFVASLKKCIQAV